MIKIKIKKLLLKARRRELEELKEQNRKLSNQVRLKQSEIESLERTIRRMMREKQGKP